MKKILLVFILIILGGCQKESIKSEKLDPMLQSTGFNQSANTSFSEKGFYYAQEGLLHFVSYNDDEAIYLGSLNMADDKSFDTSGIDYDRYIELQTLNILYYDKHIYYVTYYESVEGDIKYFLKRVDEQGKNPEQLIAIPFSAMTFFVDEAKAYIVSFDNDDKSQVMVYDLNTNESVLHEVEFGPMLTVRCSGTSLYFHLIEEIIEVKKETFELIKRIVPDNPLEYILFINGDYVITHTTNVLETADMTEPLEITASLYKQDQLIMTFDTELINYVDEEYVYTSQLEGNQIYRKYDMDKNLISEIVFDGKGMNLRDFDKFGYKVTADVISKISTDEMLSRVKLDGYIHTIKCSFITKGCTVLKSNQPKE